MESINSTYFKSIRGPSLKVHFYANEKGITKVDLFPHAGEGFEWKMMGDAKKNPVFPLIQNWVETYCKRRQPTVILPLVLEGLPPYTTQVLSILRDIPFGVSLSYQELAEVTGNIQGARAVGNACARNPLPLLIPCHRVLGSHNLLGGFSAGIEVKKGLLNFEKIPYIKKRSLPSQV